MSLKKSCQFGTWAHQHIHHSVLWKDQYYVKNLSNWRSNLGSNLNEEEYFCPCSWLLFCYRFFFLKTNFIVIYLQSNALVLSVWFNILANICIHVTITMIKIQNIFITLPNGFMSLSTQYPSLLAPGNLCVLLLRIRCTYSSFINEWNSMAYTLLFPASFIQPVVSEILPCCCAFQ